MRTEGFFAPKVLVVSGKGGVGKTTVSAALALVAARQGRKVCVAAVDERGDLPKLFGRDLLSYVPSELAPDVWGINIQPENALAEYLKVQYHMSHISRVFASTHFVDYITTAAPGLKDVLVLGKVWYLEQNRPAGGRQHSFDTIIVDAPAAGHMLTFLSAPMGLSDALRVGPLRRQSDWLVDMLRDPKRTRVHLVTLAEEMPVSETLETSTALRDPLRIESGAVFANAVYSELLSDEEEGHLDDLVTNGSAEALVSEAKAVGLSLEDEDVEALLGYARFRRARRSIQNAHLDELRADVAKPVVELPFLFSPRLALPDLEELADAIEQGLEKL